MAEPPAPNPGISTGFWATVLAPFVKGLEIYQLLKRTDDLAADIRKQSAEIKELGQRLARLEGAFAQFTEDIDRMDRNINAKVKLAVMESLKDKKNE
jgi:ABC-type transporter Mla subunit MlaD